MGVKVENSENQDLLLSMDIFCRKVTGGIPTSSLNTLKNVEEE